MRDDWTIVEHQFRAETALAYEGLFTLGSGYLHLRGSLEEHLPDAPQNLEYVRRPANVTSECFPHAKARWGTYVPGVFGPHPWLNAEMINLPWPAGITPIVDGEILDVETGLIEEYRRELRLDTATLLRRLRWRTKTGVLVALRFERFISAARPHMLVQRMKLSADRKAQLTLSAGIDADVRTNGYDHFREMRFAPLGRSGLSAAVRTDSGIRVELATRMYAPGLKWEYAPAPRAAALLASTTLPAGMEVAVEKRTAVATSRDLTPRAATDWLSETDRQTFAELHAEHARCWEQRWERCDVVVEGDQQAQRALRASLYHLLRAHVPDDARVAIDGKGYAGEAYWGRYFWDTEMFLLPFFLYTDPPRARTLVDFRVNTLPGAQRNASRYGYGGARYAWESDADGNECCPNWQYADHEVHVTADVAYGLAHYARATGDDDYLRGPAARVVVETARYWMQRLDRRPGAEHPCLLGVMGPDEFKPISNNNAYTNRLVRFALRLAAEVGPAGGATAEECAAFRQAADGLPIPRDATGGLVLQCEGFDQLPDLDFERFWKDRDRTLASQVSQERLYRSRCLKQADVLMLMLLFPDEFSAAELRRAWDYYVPITTHDSSLSPGVHAIIACRLGLTDAAQRFWDRAAAIDLDVARGGAAQGIHISNAALLWQMAVLGFAGMKTAMQSQVLSFQPRLPESWSRLSFPVCWKGGRVRVEIGRAQMSVTNVGDRPLEVCVGAATHTLPPGLTQTWPLTAPARQEQTS